MGLFDIAGDIVGGIFGSDASQKEADAAQQAMAQQNSTYQTNSGNFSPYINSGRATLSQLLSGLQSGAFQTNVNPQTLANDPGYQFQMQQGQQALQRSAAAKGMLNSGAFAKGLDQYSQGLAGQQYQNAWNRNFQQNQANYGNLYNLANMGSNASNQLAGLGQNYANSMSSLWGAYGSAQAGKDQAWGNAFSSGLRDLGSTLSNGASAMGGGGGAMSGGGGAAAAAGGPGLMQMLGGLL